MALPCTDRLISTNMASLLRAAGINAVMAHKGEALVRFNGLEAVNGDGLAVAGAAPKRAVSDARFAVQSKIDAKGAQASARFAPAVRKGSVAPAGDEAVDEPVAEPEEAVAETSDSADESVPAGADESVSADADESASASVDGSSAPANELAALLAEADEPPAPAEDEPAAEAPMDPELAALLKSLG